MCVKMTLLTCYRSLLMTILIQESLLCPVIHINTERGADSNGYPQITTILQSDHIKDIFDNVTQVLMDKQEERFRDFVTVLDVSALPIDCQDVRTLGHTQNGVYTIYPRTTQGFPVYCDMDNGAWTVIQKRINGTENFKRDWNSYLTGFGNADHEYWFGNQQIHLLTTSGWYQLRIDMTNQTGHSKHVIYDVFSISDAESGFRLCLDGFYGYYDIDDNLSYHNGQKFSTFDRDQDSNGSNCADRYHGGWWYNSCHYVNLNGKYGLANEYGLNWYSWTRHSASVYHVEMKIRRYTRNA